MSFYESPEWLELRYKVLKIYGPKCMACKTTDQPLHVDHVAPRSKYPSMELDINNLQVLCKSCNLGKSNTDETDWRTIILTHESNFKMLTYTIEFAEPMYLGFTKMLSESDFIDFFKSQGFSKEDLHVIRDMCKKLGDIYKNKLQPISKYIISDKKD